MSDNFWFNEDAFQVENPDDNNNSSLANNDDFLSGFFNPSGVQENTTSNSLNNENVSHQNRAATSVDSNKVPNSFHDVTPASLLTRKENDQTMNRHQSLESSMYSSKPTPQTVMGNKQYSPPEVQTSDVLRNEQLLKMRQQIRQQQMSQNDPKAHSQHSIIDQNSPMVTNSNPSNVSSPFQGNLSSQIGREMQTQGPQRINNINSQNSSPHLTNSNPQSTQQMQFVASRLQQQRIRQPSVPNKGSIESAVNGTPSPYANLLTQLDATPNNSQHGHINIGNKLGSTEPGSIQAASIQSRNNRPINAHAGNVQPGKPGNYQLGSFQPKNVQPGNFQSGNIQPGNIQSGNIQSGNIQPGNIQSGNIQPGNIQPGNIQPGNIQPGNIQPGNVQPGNVQSGNVQPGNVQPGNVQPGKLTQSQIAQLQFRLFLAVLSDYMSRRGTPISQPPMVNNKPINLFFLYMLCQRLGGKDKLVADYRNSQSQNSLWPTVSQKFRLYDGINIQEEPNKKNQIDEEIKRCYIQYLLPYEEYYSTLEGQRDIQQRRMYFQKQILSRLQSQNPLLHRSSATEVQVPQGPKHPQQAQDSPISVAGTQSPITGPNKPPFSSATVPNASPYQSQIPEAAPQRISSRTSNPSNHNSPSVTSSPYVQQQIPRSGSVSHQVPQKPVSAQSTPATQARFPTQPMDEVSRRQVSNRSSETPKPHPVKEKEVIKNFVPSSRSVETYAGVDIKMLSSIGAEIETTKPVYLFAPELGSINIHALTMALKNYEGPDSGEAFSALNTLLVTTSDSSHIVRVLECPELVDTLALLGLKIINRIVDGSTNNDNNSIDVSDISSSGNIDQVFSKYAGCTTNSTMKNENIAFTVDSLTGLVVDDDESDGDMDVDDIFSLPGKTKSNISTPPAHDLEKGYTHFYIPDYMTTLLKFKEENRYHFSTLQTKCAVDDNVFLVDQLITVTMILRNISFSEFNRELLAKNVCLKDLIFQIIKNLALHHKKFLFHRKRLCLMKDCLVILDNIAYDLELDTLEQTFLCFILISSFGPKLEEGEEIPKASMQVYSYLPTAVDAFAKLLVREPHNRSLFHAVLSGNLSSVSTSFGGNVSNLNITKDDEKETKNLILAYLDGNEPALRNGVLFTKSFQILLCVIPFHASVPEMNKIILGRVSTLCQSFFAAKILIDLVSSDEALSPISLLPVKWLLANSDLILCNLSRVAFALVPECAKLPRKSNEQRILNLFLIKAFIFLSSLLSSTLCYYNCTGDNVIKQNVCQIKDHGRILPERNQVLDFYMSGIIEQGLCKEILRFTHILHSFPTNSV